MLYRENHSPVENNVYLPEDNALKEIKAIALIARTNAFLEMLPKMKGSVQRRGIIENVALGFSDLKTLGSEAIVKNKTVILVSENEKEYVNLIRLKIKQLRELSLFIENESDMLLVNIAESYIIEATLFLEENGFIIERNRIIGWTRLTKG